MCSRIVRKLFGDLAQCLRSFPVVFIWVFAATRACLERDRKSICGQGQIVVTEDIFGIVPSIFGISWAALRDIQQIADVCLCFLT